MSEAFAGLGQEQLAGPSRRMWTDLDRLRREWLAGELEPGDEVPTSWGSAAVRDLASLPIQDLARMAHAELVELTADGQHQVFGLSLVTFADPARLSLSPQRAKPLLGGLMDAGYDEKDAPPRAYVKLAQPLVLADELSELHCHFSGGQTTPVQALELLRRAGVNESAAMVSVHPTDAPEQWIDEDKRELVNGIMSDLIGLRLQFPPETAISVSCDDICGPALEVAVSAVNDRCVAENLPPIERTELPVAMTTQRTQRARRTRDVAGPATPGSPSDPLAPGYRRPGKGPRRTGRGK